MALSTPGYCTLTATMRPSRSTALWTWPMEAAATGTGSQSRKTRSGSAPRSSRTTEAARLGAIGGTSAWRDSRAARASGGRPSATKETIWPTFMMAPFMAPSSRATSSALRMAKERSRRSRSSSLARAPRTLRATNEAPRRAVRRQTRRARRMRSRRSGRTRAAVAMPAPAATATPPRAAVWRLLSFGRICLRLPRVDPPRRDGLRPEPRAGGRRSTERLGRPPAGRPRGRPRTPRTSRRSRRRGAAGRARWRPARPRRRPGPPRRKSPTRSAEGHRSRRAAALRSPLVMDAVAFEDDLEAAQRDAERLRGDALVERARIIAEALRDAEEWLTEAEQERERLLAEARGLAAELVGEAEEQAEAWLGEVDAERSRLEAEAEGVRTAARMQGAALLAAAGAVAAARLDDVDAQVRGLLVEAGDEAERLVAAALERRGVLEDELDGLRTRVDEARTALAEIEEQRPA